ncbi:SusC/RagA family TonB-linked outer membrane protein [Flavobacterium acetivorans]|uniref:SusC/RagA family TonB-linked outer membrane protein n=1 Tax=Flavobacterium acetivorans TaxID=2893883 RepID=UPI001E3BCB4F|nr:SusC/RagA family TonB-linked outer membrane protein [Flavobacterium sp. F-29]UFH35820.1 SusC/RagA family TonB-linked outer membrane protein [Flavobacterium sp. F-29]
MKLKFNGILVLLLVLIAQLTFAQERTVTGVVSDNAGMPLPGVSVLVKGTKTGTQTDFDGKYTIKASPSQVLIFSYIGMKTQEVAAASTSLNIKLKDDSQVLEEVVVTALGVQRQKKTLTYQAEKIESKELLKADPTRSASALAGKVAGLQINVQDNGVDPSSQIILRGLRSISQSNSALIVIDGSISTQGAFDDLNPRDIESLNVLKGATAAALYGSLAGNGAIIVETKKGKIGESFTVGLNSTTTIENVAYMPEFQSEYGTGWQGAYDNIENTNWGPRFDGQVRQIGPIFADGTFQAVPYAPVKNNLKDFFQTGTTVQNTISFSGGDESSTFFMSIGDQRTKGIVHRDEYKRNTFRVNATKKIGNLKLGLTSNFLKDKTSVVGNTIGNQDRPLYWFILNTASNIPLASYKDWRNDLYSSPDGYFNGYYENPWWAIDNNRNDNQTSRLTANISAAYDFNKWLNFTARAGVNTTSGIGKNWRSRQVYDKTLQPAANDISSFVEDREFQSLSYTTDALLSAKLDITSDIDFIGLLGASTSSISNRDSFIRANNLSIPDFYDVSNGTGQPEINVAESNKKTFGYFADLTFGFKKFIYLNLQGRYDYTSTLPEADNSYFYPAAGLSFVITEAFPSLKDSSLSFGKLTFSNSTVYNDLGAYQINETFSQSNGFPFGSLNGFSQSGTAVDSNISKEKINTSEIGANLAFFKNRLRIDASYFITKSTNLITFTTPSVSSGATNYLTNIGEIEGKGIELTIGGTVLKSNDFSWDLNVNYSKNEAVVKSITEGVDEITVTSNGTYGVFAVVGEAFPQIKASSYVRDPQGNVVIDAASGNPLVGSLKNLGKTTPDYIVGLTSSINYKNWNLSTTMDYRTGHVYYEQGSDVMEFTGRSIESVSSNRQDFVFPNSVIETSPGVFVPNTNIPVTDGRQDFWTNTYNEIKENYVKDATAFKIREVALNYDLPKNYLAKTALKSLRIGFVGRNILTLLPKENRFSDPEFNNTNSNAIGVGGYFQSPPTRSFGVSINAEF